MIKNTSEHAATAAKMHVCCFCPFKLLISSYLVQAGEKRRRSAVLSAVWAKWTSPGEASPLRLILCSHVDCVDVYWGCRLAYSPLTAAEAYPPPVSWLLLRVTDSIKRWHLCNKRASSFFFLFFLLLVENLIVEGWGVQAAGCATAARKTTVFINVKKKRRIILSCLLFSIFAKTTLKTVIYLSS